MCHSQYIIVAQMKTTKEIIVKARIPDALNTVLAELVRKKHARNVSDALRISIEAGAEKYKIPLEVAA